MDCSIDEAHLFKKGYPIYELVNINLAIEAFIENHAESSELRGFTDTYRTSLSELLDEEDGIRPGAVGYRRLYVGRDEEAHQGRYQEIPPQGNRRQSIHRS